MGTTSATNYISSISAINSRNYSCGAGGIAGALGIAVSQPLDTVRVRMQQQPHNGGKYLNAIQMLGSIVRREGALSLFKGLSFPLAFTALQVRRYGACERRRCRRAATI